ncbi:hypothetical protein Hanom_Chr06g00493931 [Helianthus anomalus]
MQIWAKMHLLISHPATPIRFLTLNQSGGAEGRSDVTPVNRKLENGEPGMNTLHCPFTRFRFMFSING